MAKKVEAYTLEDSEYKSEIDHVRERVGVYFGGDPKNVATREIYDNSFDEAIAGFATDVAVILHDDGSVEVKDNGRGIPVDTKDGMSGIEFLLGRLRSSGKFNNKGAYTNQNQSGLNGMGGAACNFISSRFDVRVYRDGKEHTLCFQRGIPGHYDGKEFDPEANFTKSQKMKVVKDPRSASEKKLYPHGTYIRFKLDPYVAADSEFDKEMFLKTLRMRTYTIPGLTLHVTSDGEERTYHEPGGLTALVQSQTGDSGVEVEPITLKGRTEILRRVYSEEEKKPVDLPIKVDYEVVVQWNAADYDSNTESFVNTINTHEGGSHVTSVQAAMGDFFSDKAKALKLLKLKEEPPILADVLEGARIAVSVAYAEPEFVGQHKASIKNTTLYNALKRAITNELTAWSSKKENKDILRVITEKAVNASRVRLEQSMAKNTARKKTKKAEGESLSMPAKFMACSRDGEGTELYIAEGDSARATIVAARDPEYQACIPIRGKIVNTANLTAPKALENDEVASIAQVIGAGFGSSFDIEKMNFERIIIATDADFDGLHISALLMGLFVTHMRPIVDAGRLFISVPPLFTFSVTPKKKGEPKYKLYAVDKNERDTIIRDLEKKKEKYIITRNKGLGEMNPDEFWDTVLNPETRTLKQLVVTKDPSDMVKMLMDSGAKAAAGRRDWIEGSRGRYEIGEFDL